MTRSILIMATGPITNAVISFLVNDISRELPFINPWFCMLILLVLLVVIRLERALLVCVASSEV